jgi:VWFA-related protein
MKGTLAAAAILVCAFASTAGSKGPQPAKLRKINVVALDAQGQPVTGLTSADFQLFEDGKPRDIAFFRFTGDRARLAKSGPHEYSNRAGAAFHATVVLIDLLTARIMSDAMVGREVSDSLKNLESSEGLYLYIMTSRGELYPIHPLPEPDTEAPPGAEPWTRNIASMLQTALNGLIGLKPVDDRDIKYRFDLTSNALRDLGARMALVSGRKNLVWVTHGIPLVGFSLSTQSRLDFTKPLRWLCEELEQAQIVVYTVDQSAAGAGAAVGTYSVESLEEYTGITGGRSFSSDSAGDAIRKARSDSRGNYEIAYYPAVLNSDWKHHKIRVTCGRKEVRLQTEQGFYAVSPPVSQAALVPIAFHTRELPVEVEAAVHSPFDATDIGLRASVSPDPIDKPLVDVHIDGADLLPRPTRDPEAGKVSVAFVSYGDGKQQASPPILVSLTPEQFAAAAQGEIGLREAIPIAPAIRRVRVIVFDAALGAVGSVTIPIQH